MTAQTQRRESTDRSMIHSESDVSPLPDAFLAEHRSSKSSRRRASRYGAQGNTAEADLAGSATPIRNGCDEEFGDLGSSMSQQRQLLDQQCGGGS